MLESSTVSKYAALYPDAMNPEVQYGTVLVDIHMRNIKKGHIS